VSSALSRAAALLLFAASGASHAGAFDPSDFASGGTFPPGAVTIDATELEVGGVPWPNAAVVAQDDGPNVAVFAFDGGAQIDANVSVVGSRPVAVLFQGPAAISGVWIVAAGRGQGGGTAPPNSEFGGTGGGGFGGRGGAGSDGIGGASYGDLFAALEGGSNGGARNGGDAALGGGALEIGALGLLDLSGALLAADGNAGASVDGDGLGGGSGGGIFLHAFDVTMDEATLVRARGGSGGDHDAGPFGIGEGGGGGGGGRIAVLVNVAGTLTQGGAALVVSGGTAGIAEPSAGPTEAGENGASEVDTSTTVPEAGPTGIGAAALAALLWRRGISASAT
jgi:hypothetical protein